MKNLKFLPLAIFSLVMFSSCEKDAEEVNEEEVITTVTTTLIGGGNVITLKSQDLDGDGSNPPIFTVDGGNLLTNTTYKGITTFTNELVKPAEDITIEVNEEGEEHQIFYQAPVAIGTFAYTDIDKNGKPIGLSFDLTTGAASATGNLTVTLRHEPNKEASGVATGNITNAGGSTDASVVFPIKVVAGKQ